jgi:hypothetical protein
MSTLAAVNGSLARFGHTPEEPILSSKETIVDQGRSLMSSFLGTPGRRKTLEGFREHIPGVSVWATKRDSPAEIKTVNA